MDTYRFLVPAGQAGTLNVESIAQRLSSSSHLDSHVTIFQMTADGPKVLATNDNSFGSDSAISIALDAQAADTTYFVSITGKVTRTSIRWFPTRAAGRYPKDNTNFASILNRPPFNLWLTFREHRSMETAMVTLAGTSIFGSAHCLCRQVFQPRLPK